MWEFLLALLIAAVIGFFVLIAARNIIAGILVAVLLFFLAWWFLGLLPGRIGDDNVTVVIPGTNTPVNQPRDSIRRDGTVVSIDCTARVADPNGLRQGHEPFNATGPAVISVWLPEDPQPTQYVYFLEESQTKTYTVPGQIWTYPKGCSEVAKREMERHINDMQRERPNLQIVRREPSRI